MQNQLLKLIKEENLTSAKFADKIGVQPSSISHILSGRNKPSYDFILKVLTTFSNVNADWLLFGKGTMYKTIRQATLFDEEFEPAKEKINIAEPASSPHENISDKNIENKEILNSEEADFITTKKEEISILTSNVEKIVIFYTDKTFSDYKPR